MNLIGRKIGSYYIESLIGKGGTSWVYLARDTRTNGKVALKLLDLQHNSDQRKVERFTREARDSVKLRHPNIVPVYEADRVDGHYYIAMRYISGGSLDQLIKEQGPLPPEKVCDIVKQVAAALDFAHQQGVVHRDVKPSNILLSSDRSTAYLADFGTAQIAGREMITEYGKLVGTPEFMSPEQIKGERVDKRSDIYSLGIAIYAALGGTPPFAADATASILYHQVNTPPRPIRQLNDKLPARIEGVLKKALSKKPGKRHRTAGGLAHNLCRAVNPKPLAKSVWLPIGLVALLLFLLAIYVIQGSASGESIIERTVFVTATPGQGGGDAEVMATSTLAPTRPPTSTPRPTFTPTRTPFPAATETAMVLGARPQLEYPAANADIRRNRAEQTFRWQWAGALARNEHFEVRFYRAGQSDHQAPFGWSKEPFKEVNLNLLTGRGDFEWSVVVIRGVDGRWEADIVESERRPIRWEGQ